MENKKDNGQYGRVEITNKGKITLKDNNILIPDLDVTKEYHIVGDFLIDANTLLKVVSLLNKEGCIQFWDSSISSYSVMYCSKDDIIKEVAEQYEDKIEKLNEYLSELEYARTKLKKYKTTTANLETKRKLWDFIHSEEISQYDHDLSVELENYLNSSEFAKYIKERY